MISRDWPKYSASTIPSPFGNGKQILNFYVFMVPYPILFFVLGRKFKITDNPMFVWITTSGDARMHRVCDSWINCPDTIDLTSTLHLCTEIRHLHKFIEIFSNQGID